MDLRLALALMSTTAAGVVLARFGLLGLASSTYRWFSVYLAAELFQAVLMLRFEKSKYGLALWCATTTALAFLRIALVFEAWSLIARCYPGISAVSRRLGALVGVLSLVISSTVGLDIAVFKRAPLPLGALAFGVRFTSLALAIVCAIMAWFATSPWFRGPVPRNVILHVRLLCGYFLSIGMGFFLMGLRKGMADLAGAIMTAAALIVYGLWMLLISREGEVSIPMRAGQDLLDLDRRDEALYAEGEAMLRHISAVED
jgi:hypothetical protein